MLRNKISLLLDEFHGAGFEQPDWDLAEAIIRFVADDIERIDITEPLITVTGFNDNYITGAKEEHTYIVEYLRGLLEQ